MEQVSDCRLRPAVRPAPGREAEREYAAAQLQKRKPPAVGPARGWEHAAAQPQVLPKKPPVGERALKEPER